MENTGVILGQRQTDYIGGTLPFVVNVPDGNWTPWLPNEEWQWIDPIDLMACVTFSGLNVLEALYYFQTGIKRNFSDRFTAYMSGTTMNGNWLWKVGDSVRQDGLVDESEYPAPQGPFTWNEYYKVPPMDIINKAKDFLRDWKINYEFIDFTRESLIHHIRQSPIQVVFPNHAVMLFTSPDQIYRYFDSYAPFIKERSEGFVSSLKYVLSKNNTMLFEQVRVDGSEDVYLVRNGKKTFVRNQNVIKVVGDFSQIKLISKDQLDAIPDEIFDNVEQGGGSIGWEPKK